MSEVVVEPGRAATLLALVFEPFAERSRVEQVFGALVLPVAFGVLCGVVLEHSTAGYWVLQALAFLGGCTAGYEHRSARSGAARGLLGGLLFGGAILVGFAVSGGHLGGTASPFLPVVNGVGGAVLGAVFGALRGRRERGAPPR